MMMILILLVGCLLRVQISFPWSEKLYFVFGDLLIRSHSDATDVHGTYLANVAQHATLLVLIRELITQIWALELGVWLTGQKAFVDLETRENSKPTFLTINSAPQRSADRCLTRAQMVHEHFWRAD